MRKHTAALWLGLGAFVVTAGFVIVAIPWTTEIAAIDEDSVSTTLTTPDPTTTTSSSSTTTTTTRALEDFTPEELVAFEEFVNPTTTTTAPPPTTTTTRPYVPPTTQPEPVYEPEPTYEEPEPAQSSYEEPSYGSGCVIPAYICQRESGHSYTALNSSSGAGGMYQFMPSTWNGIARQIAPEWVGTPPHTAPPHVQDQFALYLWAGGSGCGHWSAC